MKITVVLAQAFFRFILTWNVDNSAFWKVWKDIYARRFLFYGCYHHCFLFSIVCVFKIVNFNFYAKFYLASYYLFLCPQTISCTIPYSPSGEFTPLPPLKTIYSYSYKWLWYFNECRKYVDIMPGEKMSSI